jgi:hypothetical protein
VRCGLAASPNATEAVTSRVVLEALANIVLLVALIMLKGLCVLLYVDVDSARRYVIWSNGACSFCWAISTFFTYSVAASLLRG